MHFPYEHHLKLTEILIAFTQCGTSGKERKWGESGVGMGKRGSTEMERTRQRTDWGGGVGGGGGRGTEEETGGGVRIAEYAARASVCILNTPTPFPTTRPTFLCKPVVTLTR